MVPSRKVREDAACAIVRTITKTNPFFFLYSVFMLRFMMLGSNINKKYQNTSLLLTEQVRQRMLQLPGC